MNKFTISELDEALRSIRSTLHKSEKAVSKLKAGTAQHTMTTQAIEAYSLAIVLIQREIKTPSTIQGSTTLAELENAIQALTSANSRVEKILPKFAPGTSQHTLAVRRIAAFKIAITLMRRDLENNSPA